MDILDALEQKVDILLEEMAALRAENALLTQRLVTTNEAYAHDNRAADHTEELEQLREKLKHEKVLRKQVLDRINTLVERLEETDIE